MASSITAVPAFAHFLRSVERILRRTGFARSKGSFWIRSGNNVGIIDVQKSTKSVVDRVIFTFNAGVWSDRVGRFVAGNAKSGPTGVDDCHWLERIGFLLKDREDKWWSIGDNDDQKTVTDEVGPIIESVAVPAVTARLSDEALRDEWLTGKAPGLTDMQRLMYLSILLKEIGPLDALTGVVAELKNQSEGKPIEAIIARHVQKLELNERSTAAR